MTTTSRGAYWLAKSPAEKLIQKMILEVLTSQGFSGWSVIFSREGRRLGVCSYRTKEITISRKVVSSDWVQAVDTAMHEAAHAIAGSAAGHGPLWKRIARELGATPKAKVEGFVNTQDHGETKQVKTTYGPVPVIVGETTLTDERFGLITVMDLQRKKFLGKAADGKLYTLSVDRLHPNYGDLSKIAPRAVKLKDGRGREVEIILGKSTYIHEGRSYIATEPRNRNVVCMDSQGNQLLVPAEYLTKN